MKFETLSPDGLFKKKSSKLYYFHSRRLASMTFEPSSGQIITIDEIDYTFCEHPSAPGIPYGQEGRSASVYQLVSPLGLKALKVFKSDFRLPALVEFSRGILVYSTLPGLEVCSRTVLTFSKHMDLLRIHPDLLYAVLMPWMEGKTWFETVASQQALTPFASQALAHSLVRNLLEMEEHSLAHCDLSGSNIIWNPQSSTASLVDIEGFYAPILSRPPKLLSGTLGYAHRTTVNGIWNEEADRFSGAVLIAEILGWCDPQVRKNAWGESYFDQAELQQENQRYRVLSACLAHNWGERVAGLFRQAWQSDTLSHCPLFGEWILALPQEPINLANLKIENELVVNTAHGNALEFGEHSKTIIEGEKRPASYFSLLEDLLVEARGHVKAGQLDVARKVYQRALQNCLPEDEAVEVIRADMRELDSIQEIGGQKPDTEHLLMIQTNFKLAINSIRKGKYLEARELLESIIREDPDFSYDGQSAAEKLLWVKEKLGRQIPHRLFAAAGIVMVCLLALGVWMANGWSMASNTPTPTSINANDTITPLISTPNVTPILTLKPSFTPTLTPTQTLTATLTDTPSPTASFTGRPAQSINSTNTQVPPEPVKPLPPTNAPEPTSAPTNPPPPTSIPPTAEPTSGPRPDTPTPP